MDASTIIGIITLIVGILTAIASGFLKLFLPTKANVKEPTLQDRISDLTKNLESAVAVVTDIEAEISKRKNLAKQLETDIERYNKLKEINQAQVEAIAQTLRIPLLKESRKSMVINGLVSFAIALIFFAIGYLVGGK